jgi:hypothetical protein
VQVKNTFDPRPVCQNAAEMHLSYRQPEAFKSMLFLALSLLYLDPKRLLECEYEGWFFLG